MPNNSDIKKEPTWKVTVIKRPKQDIPLEMKVSYTEGLESLKKGTLPDLQNAEKHLGKFLNQLNDLQKTKQRDETDRNEHLAAIQLCIEASNNQLPLLDSLEAKEEKLSIINKILLDHIEIYVSKTNYPKTQFMDLLLNFLNDKIFPAKKIEMILNLLPLIHHDSQARLAGDYCIFARRCLELNIDHLPFNKKAKELLLGTPPEQRIGEWISVRDFLVPPEFKTEKTSMNEVSLKDTLGKLENICQLITDENLTEAEIKCSEVINVIDKNIDVYGDKIPLGRYVPCALFKFANDLVSNPDTYKTSEGARKRYNHIYTIISKVLPTSHIQHYSVKTQFLLSFGKQIILQYFADDFAALIHLKMQLDTLLIILNKNKSQDNQNNARTIATLSIAVAGLLKLADKNNNTKVNTSSVQDDKPAVNLQPAPDTIDAIKENSRKKKKRIRQLKLQQKKQSQQKKDRAQSKPTVTKIRTNLPEIEKTKLDTVASVLSEQTLTTADIKTEVKAAEVQSIKQNAIGSTATSIKASESKTEPTGVKSEMLERKKTPSKIPPHSSWNSPIKIASKTVVTTPPQVQPNSNQAQKHESPPIPNKPTSQPNAVPALSPQQLIYAAVQQQTIMAAQQQGLVTTLQQQLNTLLKRTEEQVNEISALKQQCETKNADNATLKKNDEKLTAELSEAKKCIEKQAAELAEAKKIIDKQTAELAEAKNLIEKQVGEQITLKQLIEKQTADLVAANQEIENQAAELKKSYQTSNEDQNAYVQPSQQATMPVPVVMFPMSFYPQQVPQMMYQAPLWNSLYQAPQYQQNQQLQPSEVTQHGSSPNYTNSSPNVPAGFFQPAPNNGDTRSTTAVTYVRQPQTFTQGK